MLIWTCRRFRARFTPGLSSGQFHPHRRACRECDAFASAVESAAGARLPIPKGLKDRLREIAEPVSETVLPFPVPRLPMPEALAGRLRAIAPPSRPAPPEWVRDPRYAVAASALLALLLGPFFSMGADRGLHALGAVRQEGREEIAKVRHGAREAYEAARRTLTRSSKSLQGFSDRLSTVVPENLFHPDPEDEPAGSSRRPR